MEAAAIPWRPLGRLLVELGLLTNEELELALAEQQVTGKRLGETIVECGFVSRPDLSNALAAQYGIELTTETGFGTGLRAQIQQRHESDRGRPTLASVPDREEPSDEPQPELTEPKSEPAGEALLLVQLEEQWAKLAAAEEKLAERETALAAVVAERDRRRAQVVRFVARVRSRDVELERRNEELQQLGEAVDGQGDEQRELLAAAQQRLAEQERELAARDRAAVALRNEAERLADDVRGCDTEIERLRNESTRRRVQGARLANQLRELRRRRDVIPVAVTPASHLVFLQLASGYQVVERDGPPPPRHSSLELPGLCDGTLVVAGSRPSPFPGDARPCIVAQPA